MNNKMRTDKNVKNLSDIKYIINERIVDITVDIDYNNFYDDVELIDSQEFLYYNLRSLTIYKGNIYGDSRINNFFNLRNLNLHDTLDSFQSDTFFKMYNLEKLKIKVSKCDVSSMFRNSTLLRKIDINIVDYNELLYDVDNYNDKLFSDFIYNFINLYHIGISGNYYENLEILNKLSNLTSLKLNYFHPVIDTNYLLFHSLKKLNIMYTHINNLQFLKNSIKLKKLSIDINEDNYFEFLNVLQYISSLTSLKITFNIPNKNIIKCVRMIFDNLLNITNMTLEHCYCSLKGINKLSNLTRLNLINYSYPEGLEYLRDCFSLKFLSLKENFNSSLEPISNLQLSELVIYSFDFNPPDGLLPLSNYTSLIKFTLISDMSHIDELNPIKNNIGLKELKFVNNNINDGRFLKYILNLSKITLIGSDVIDTQTDILNFIAEKSYYNDLIDVGKNNNIDLLYKLLLKGCNVKSYVYKIPDEYKHIIKHFSKFGETDFPIDCEEINMIISDNYRCTTLDGERINIIEAFIRYNTQHNFNASDCVVTYKQQNEYSLYDINTDIHSTDYIEPLCSFEEMYDNFRSRINIYNPIESHSVVYYIDYDIRTVNEKEKIIFRKPLILDSIPLFFEINGESIKPFQVYVLDLYPNINCVINEDQAGKVIMIDNTEWEVVELIKPKYGHYNNTSMYGKIVHLKYIRNYTHSEVLKIPF